MSAVEAVALAASVVLAVYLLYALLRGEEL
jgi:hypothetical protein